MKRILQKEKIIYVCDNCEKEIDNGLCPVNLDFNYPSELDGSSFHFCSIECLNNFVKDIENNVTKCSDCIHYSKKRRCSYNLKPAANCNQYEEKSWFIKLFK